MDIQRESAQQYARVQNYMNDFLIIAFSGVVAQPDFYGIDMAPTQTFCPATDLSADGNVLALQFGAGSSEGSCTMLTATEVGGDLVLNKNFCPDIVTTRECQPGSLEFDQLNVRDCNIEALRSNENDNLHPTFYSWKNCNNINDEVERGPDDLVDFWFDASDEWEMRFSDPNGALTTFDPINKENGAFMNIQAPNVFVGELNFEDLYSLSYQISLLQQDSEFNEVNFIGVGEEGEDLRMKVVTTEELVFRPYQCQNIISGQILLMDTKGTPLVNIDYSAGAEESDYGRCDNIVRICPCDENGTVISESSDCMITSCLPQ